MIAANEQVAKLLARAQGAGALPRPRAARPGSGRAARRAARVARGADAAAAEHMSPRRPPSCVGEISRLVDAARRAHAATAGAALTRSCCARSSRPTTRRATSATPGCARRATATSRRRSAAIPTSSATARCWRRSAAGEHAPRAERAGRAGAVVLGARARGDGRSSATPTTSPAASRSSASFERGRERARRARSSGADRRPGAFVAFGERRALRGHAAGARGCAGRTGGSSTRRGRSCTATRSGATLRLGDPVRVRVDRIEAPARAGRPRARAA